MTDAKIETGKSADKYDYVVVGSGPGGATVANRLTANPKLRVLVLEAGPNADAAPAISVSANAWMLPMMYVPQYFWQMAAEPYVTNFDSTNTLPQSPTRRRLHHDHTSYEQYMGGRLLGGSSSINGEQVGTKERKRLGGRRDDERNPHPFFPSLSLSPKVVWPTAKLLASWQAAAGGDPDWAPDACFTRLRSLETFTGSSPAPRGGSGPLAVSQEPQPATASTYGTDFVAATQLALGADAPGVVDYNDPSTPISVFPQWQLSQNATTRARSSSSVSMLSKDVQSARSNLVVRTQATALRVLFEGNVAVGVLYLDGGNIRTATATREVIVAAGHRSSLLLEQSGVGNRTIIEPLLAKDGRRVVADVPAVGENLGNDGVVLVPLNTTGVAGVGLANPNDLYAGGAFLPYPNSATRGSTPQTSDRFSQIIGAPFIQDDAANNGNPTFSVGAILLNTSSTGYAHIQSGDPFDAPLVLLPTFGNTWDQSNWYWLMKYQVGEGGGKEGRFWGKEGTSARCRDDDNDARLAATPMI